MIHIIEEPFNIKLNDKVQMGQLHQVIGSCDCIFYRPVRAETKAVFTEFRFTYWLHYLLDTLLYQPVPYTGNTERPCRFGVMGFGNVFSSHRFRAIAVLASSDDKPYFVHHFIHWHFANIFNGEFVCASCVTASVRFDIAIR